ncbi:MAG: MFS transporter [Coprothermobacterota bacterium]|nr:MFS transporter [Coprothermobacterota bacterium]
MKEKQRIQSQSTHSSATEEIPAEEAVQRGPLRGLHPNVVRLGLVSFFADVASEMLYPLTPIFLSSVLGAPASVIGLIEGVAEATASLLKVVAGRWSDRSGRRRPFLLFGYTLSALSKPLLALAAGWPLVMGARIADRFGKGMRSSPRDALLADSVAPEMRGRAFGWHRAMDTMGAVVGPLLALLLISMTNDNLRLIFILAVIPGLLGAFLVLFVKEQRRAPSPAQAPKAVWASLPRPFRLYLLAWGIFALTNSSDVFLILRAQSIGFTPTLVVLAYALYNLTYAGASPFLGQLSDRLGRKWVLVGGLLVFAAVYLGFAFIGFSWEVWLLFAVYGFYVAATDGVGKALAVDLVPAEIRGGALGLLGTVSGLATLVASTLAGYLWSAVGPWAMFVYGAAGALVCSVLMAALPISSNKIKVAAGSGSVPSVS